MITPPRLGALLATLALTAGVVGSHGGSVASHSAEAHRAASTGYTFQTVANPHDVTFTQLLGINDGRTIAGYYGSGQTVNGTPHPNRGFTLSLPTRFRSENFPHAVQTQVIAIDNAGDTGGFYVDRAGTTHGFLRVRGRFQTVDRPGTTFNQILGLNSRGQAAGYFQDAHGHDHAYIRSRNGAFETLPIGDSQATGINDAGIVVGFSQPSDTTSAGFVVQGGVLRLLIYPGSAFTQALGENNRGQVVGFYNDSAGAPHGFLYDLQARTYQPINVPGASATTINGINDAGEIVGFFGDANGNTLGLIGTPGAIGVQGTVQSQPTSTPTNTPTNTPVQSAATPTATPTGTQPMGTTITLGLVLPLSGQDATLGLSAEHGAQLAVDQANASRLVPGVTFALDARDDAGASGAPDGPTGAAAVTSLIADARVAGIIGPFDTSTALQELPPANRANLAVVSPSAGDPCLTSGDAAAGCTAANALLATVRPTGTVTFFRTLPTDAQQGIAMADYLSNTKGFKTVSIVDDAGSYGMHVANAFSRQWTLLGGVVLGHVSVPEGTAGYENVLTQIAAHKPDVLFYGGSDPAAGTPGSISIRRQMLLIPGLTNTTFAGTDGIRTQLFAQTISPLLGGRSFSTLTPADAATIPSAASFVQQYQAVYGALGRYSASGYDSANVLLAAIQAAIGRGAHPATSTSASAQDFRSVVLNGVTMTKLQGLTGTLSFATNGDLAQGPISIEQLASVNGAATWSQTATAQVP